jgi:hypothetical protein
MTQLGVLFLIHLGLGIANDVLSVAIVSASITTLTYTVYLMTVMHATYMLVPPNTPLSLVDVLLTGTGSWAQFGVIFAARMIAGAIVSEFQPDLKLSDVVTMFIAYKSFLDCCIVFLAAFIVASLLVFGVSENDPKFAWKSSSVHVIVGLLFGTVFFDPVFAPFRIGPVPGGGLFLTTQHRCLAFLSHTIGTIFGVGISIPLVRNRWQ